MPDRSPSHQGLPEEWSHGSHAARGPFSTSGTPDSYGAPDGYGAPDSYGAGSSGAHRARASEGFGTGETDAFGVRTAGSYATGAADPFGAAADPFGGGDPFGAPFRPTATATFAAVSADDEAVRLNAEHPATADAAPAATTDARGFLGALFDFGFTSFVTPSVIKVLYMLIVIGTVVSALVFTIIVFKASVAFGILMLVFGDPLFILIVLAIYRIILEFFMVTFRVADDIRALRERGDLR